MKEFFDTIRSFTGSFDQSQVEGINKILDVSSSLPVMYRAYVLATAWHETGGKMSAIYERGDKAYFNKYNAGTKLGKALGNTLPGDGYRFRGRGLVQLTGRANYQNASDKLQLDLVANPDKALDLDIAVYILVEGMMQGWFTGKRMADYSTYRDMRRVVNGTDKADLIAGYANHFERALRAIPAPVAPEQPEDKVIVPPAKPPRMTIGEVMIWILGAIAAVGAAWLGFGGK